MTVFRLYNGSIMKEELVPKEEKIINGVATYQFIQII